MNVPFGSAEYSLAGMDLVLVLLHLCPNNGALSTRVENS